MFAPRHAVAASELARVLRSGGTLAMANWTPEGFGGRMFRMMAGFLPPPPDFASPPPLWGSEPHLEEIFAGRGIELTFRHETTNFAFPSVEAMIDACCTHLGPFLAVRAILEPEGRWDDLRGAFRELIRDERRLRRGRDRRGVPARRRRQGVTLRSPRRRPPAA